MATSALMGPFVLGRRLLRKAPTHRQVTAAVGLLDGISGDAGPASSPSTWWARTVCRNRRFPSAGRGAGVWLVRGAHVRCRAQLGDDLAHLRLDRRTHGRAGCRGGSAAMPDGPAPGVAARDPRPGLRDLASHLEPHGRKRPAAGAAKIRHRPAVAAAHHGRPLRTGSAPGVKRAGRAPRRRRSYRRVRVGLGDGQRGPRRGVPAASR